METQQLSPEEVKKNIMGQGNDLLAFLNKPGVAPPMTPQTMMEFHTWQRCCNLAIGLMSGELSVTQAEPQNLLPPEMEAAKNEAIANATKKAVRKPARKARGK